jgi:hypothetical protein
MAFDSGKELDPFTQVAMDVKYMRHEIDNLTQRMDLAATKTDIEVLRKEIEAKIEANSPSTLFSKITRFAVGLVSMAAASGVVVAILKAFKVF